MLFYFDYLDFLKDTEELRSRVAKGDYAPVVERARNIASHIPKGEWTLESLGTHLSQSKLSSSKTGPVELTAYAMLVILSEYLRPVDINYRSFGLLGYAVLKLGWSVEQVQLFRQGLIPAKLFHSDFDLPSTDDPIWVELRSDPKNYWIFVRPGQAMKDGVSWYTLEHLRIFQQHLLEDQTKYEQIDFERFNKEITSSYPGLLRTQPTVEEWLQFYHDVLHLFRQALSNGVGLYRVITL